MGKSQRRRTTKRTGSWLLGRRHRAAPSHCSRPSKTGLCRSVSFGSSNLASWHGTSFVFALLDCGNGSQRAIGLKRIGWLFRRVSNQFTSYTTCSFLDTKIFFTSRPRKTLCFGVAPWPTVVGAVTQQPRKKLLPQPILEVFILFVSIRKCFSGVKIISLEKPQQHLFYVDVFTHYHFYARSFFMHDHFYARTRQLP